MSWRTDLLAEPPRTREYLVAYMDAYPNRNEFDYEIIATTVGKRPIIPIWHIQVVRAGDDLKDPRKWVHAWRVHRAAAPNQSTDAQT